MIRILVLLMVFLASPLGAVDALLLGSYTWRLEDDNFGGFSSIEISDDGKSFTSTSDRGGIIRGEIQRTDDIITGISRYRLESLRDSKGQVLKDHQVDAEGLAIDRYGRMFISFEANHRVWRYDEFGGKSRVLKGHPGFQSLQNNSGLEALAIDNAGVLYTLPERSGEWERPFPVFRYRNGKWDNAFTIPRRDRFLPVGADFGPDGKFYLLERDFVWYAGFTTRIRRFDLSESGFVNEELLLTTRSGTHGNLEGIGVWQDDQGRTRMTLVADDNFSLLLTTDIVEYVLKETRN